MFQNGPWEGRLYDNRQVLPLDIRILVWKPEFSMCASKNQLPLTRVASRASERAKKQFLILFNAKVTI